MEKTTASEAAEQRALVEWGNLNGIIFVKISNEGLRIGAGGALAKKSGLRSGFPDIFVPEPTLEFSGAFVEMKQNRIYTKSEKKTKTWINQQWWLDYLNDKGYYAFRGYGWHHAVQILEHFYFG